MTTSHRIRAVLLMPAVALAMTGALSACGSSTTTTSSTPSATGATSAATSLAPKPTGQAGQLTVTDPWVKAVDTGMTGAFLIVKNTGTAEVHIVSASSPASPMMELHETVMDSSGSMKMQEKKGGFILKAGETHEFKPGSDHIMFMGVSSPLKSGTTATFTLKFADGSTLPVKAEVRTFSGAKETYVPGATTGSNPMATMTSHG
ncbi:MAG: copper chaperone PCu(A)C [Dermatophilaceae bacterium]|nr:copper chaperone PCu(A)C [Dermatophilaceae bacterium]MBP9917900.1 copper chaperone PCu(A)C [Dermatophilaceae bacterium]